MGLIDVSYVYMWKCRLFGFWFVISDFFIFQKKQCFLIFHFWYSFFWFLILISTILFLFFSVSIFRLFDLELTSNCSIFSFFIISYFFTFKFIIFNLLLFNFLTRFFFALIFDARFSRFPGLGKQSFCIHRSYTCGTHRLVGCQ